LAHRQSEPKHGEKIAESPFPWQGPCRALKSSHKKRNCHALMTIRDPPLKFKGSRLNQNGCCCLIGRDIGKASSTFRPKEGDTIGKKTAGCFRVGQEAEVHGRQTRVLHCLSHAGIGGCPSGDGETTLTAGTSQKKSFRSRSAVRIEGRRRKPNIKNDRETI